MSAADPLAPARAKLDARIAAAARLLVGAIESETEKRGSGSVTIVVPREYLHDLRANVAAFSAFEDTLGDGA